MGLEQRMRIAICDNDRKDLNRLANLMNDYRTETKASFTFRTFSDGMKLLQDVRRVGFDFLLLVIMMRLQAEWKLHVKSGN